MSNIQENTPEKEDLAATAKLLRPIIADTLFKFQAGGLYRALIYAKTLYAPQGEERHHFPSHINWLRLVKITRFANLNFKRTDNKKVALDQINLEASLKPYFHPPFHSLILVLRDGDNFYEVALNGLDSPHSRLQGVALLKGIKAAYEHDKYDLLSGFFEKHLTHVNADHYLLSGLDIDKNLINTLCSELKGTIDLISNLYHEIIGNPIEQSPMLTGYSKLSLNKALEICFTKWKILNPIQKSAFKQVCKMIPIKSIPSQFMEAASLEDLYWAGQLYPPQSSERVLFGSTVELNQDFFNMSSEEVGPFLEKFQNQPFASRSEEMMGEYFPRPEDATLETFIKICSPSFLMRHNRIFGPYLKLKQLKLKQAQSLDDTSTKTE